MLEIEPKQYTRDPEYIRKLLSKHDKVITVKKDLYVVFPKKFVDRDLTVLGTTSSVFGVFAIVEPDKKKYSVSRVPARLTMQPTEVDSTVINGMEYYVLYFMEGLDMVSNTTTIKDNGVAFDLYDLLFIQGKVPWYIAYTDLPIIFHNLVKYAASESGKNKLAFELLTAIIARSPEDKMVELRNILRKVDDIYNITPDYVGLSDIWYTFKSTLSKLAGAYMKQGIVSSIIYPEKEISKLEHVIRE